MERAPVGGQGGGPGYLYVRAPILVHPLPLRLSSRPLGSPPINPDIKAQVQKSLTDPSIQQGSNQPARLRRQPFRWSRRGGPGAPLRQSATRSPPSPPPASPLSANALKFFIIDKCPASEALSGGQYCEQCRVGELNDMGEPWHFDIAIDAMSTAEYNRGFFLNSVTDGE